MNKITARNNLLGCLTLLKKSGVAMVLEDEGFGIGTPPAVNATMCATRFLEWMEANRREACNFAVKIVRLVDVCITDSKNQRVAREKMWINYYKLRSVKNIIHKGRK